MKFRMQVDTDDLQNLRDLVEHLSKVLSLMEDKYDGTTRGMGICNEEGVVIGYWHLRA
jgi:hypothetical protein